MSIRNDLIIKATANNSVDERYDNPTFTTFGYTAPGRKKPITEKVLQVKSAALALPIQDVTLKKVEDTFRSEDTKESGNTGDKPLLNDVASILERKAEIEFLYGESEYSGNESDCSDDEDEYPTLSNPQSNNEKRSSTPDSGYRSDDDAGQQEPKIVALPNYQLNTRKPLTSPKSINLQTRPQTPFARVMFENNNTSHPNQQQCTTALQNKEKLNGSHVSTKIPVTTTLSKELRKMPENKISYPSFNKGHDSGLASNQALKNSIQERIKMFENKTPSNFRHDSGLASNQASKNSIQERIKMFENKTPSNFRHDSELASNQASKNSIQERIKMFENKTPSNFRHDSGLASDQAPKNSIQERIKMFENNTPFNLGSKVSSCSIKKVLNRSNFLS